VYVVVEWVKRRREKEERRKEKGDGDQGGSVQLR
jgi:hypothetical protein